MSYDPTKLLARAYDALVVSKGGRSIFACRPEGELSAAAERRFGQWQYETPHVHDITPGPRPDGRIKTPLPGRLTATLTGKLGGFESDWGF